MKIKILPKGTMKTANTNKKAPSKRPDQKLVKKPDIEKLRHHFFASCPRGLEELLEKELVQLGIEEVMPEKGGISFKCKPHLAFKAIVHSRLASRIYMGLFEFDAKKEKDIYFEAKKFDWKKEFTLGQTFKINTIQSSSPNGQKRSQFKNSMFLGIQLKDAIVDRFRRDQNERPDVDPEDADYPLLLFVRPYDNPYSTKEKCTVLVDLCGVPLSNRGHRSEKFPAPLRENLAAAIIQLSGLKENEVFIDGMCGSGTLTLEALMLQGNIPAGHMRVQEYLYQQTPWKFLQMKFYTRDRFLQQKFDQVISEAKAQYNQGKEKLKHMRFIANDNNTKALNVTRRHLANAGLDNIVKFTQLDIADLTVKEKGEGVLVVNPPYGERLESGEEEKLKNLYYDMGENFKANFKGFRAYVLTGNIGMLKQISLRTSKKHILYNGNIECRLAEYLLY